MNLHLTDTLKNIEGIDWSRFVPRAGEEFMRTVQDELIPQLDGFMKIYSERLERRARALGVFEEIARRAQDMLNRQNELLDLIRRPIEGDAKDDKTVFDFLAQMVDETKDKDPERRMCDFRTWINTSENAFMLLCGLSGRYIENMRRQDAVAAEYRDRLRSAEVYRAFMTGYCQVELNAYALVTAPVKYRVKIFRELSRVCAQTIAWMDECEAKKLVDKFVTSDVKNGKMEESDREQAHACFAEMRAFVRKVHQFCRGRRKDVSERGVLALTDITAEMMKHAAPAA